MSIASYPVTVGAGATGGFTTKGSNSVFAGSSTITSTGGGTGGVRSPAQPGGPAIAGNPGGSGGGAGTYAGAGPAAAVVALEQLEELEVHLLVELEAMV